MNLGNLLVTLGADDSQLNAALRRSGQGLSDFGKRARAGVNAAAKYGAGMAAAGAAIATHFTRQQMDSIDAASKLSRQLNTTTESIATMQRAGQLAGITDMESNMERLNRRLGEAARGTGQAARAMEQLNLDASEVQRLPIDERMRVISRAMRENVDATERASVAADLFGRSGTQMLEVLDDADGLLDKAAAQADAFGLAVSEVDARAVEKANDALSSIRAVLDGVFRRIAVQVAPIVTELAERFESVAMETRGFESQVTRSMEMAAKGIAFAADGVQGLRVVFQGVVAAGSSMASALISVSSQIQQAFVTVLQGITDRIRGIAELVNRLPGPDIPLGGLERMDDKLEGTKQFLDDMRIAANSAASEARDRFMELAQQEMPSEKVEAFFDAAREASREAAEEMVRNRERMMGLGGDDDDDEIAAMREQMADRLERLRESLLTEREAEQEHHQQRLEMLRDARENEIMTEEEINELKEREQNRHADEMRKIALKGLNDIESDLDKSGSEQASVMTRHMGDMQRGVSQALGAMAQDNKAFGVAQAIVNTWRGVSESLAAYPWPVSGVMAAASLAAGLKTVNNLKSGSQGGSISGGGASSAQASQTAPQGSKGGGGEPSRSATIRVQGNVFDRETVIGLADQMSELQQDGYDLQVAR